MKCSAPHSQRETLFIRAAKGNRTRVWAALGAGAKGQVAALAEVEARGVVQRARALGGQLAAVGRYRDNTRSSPKHDKHDDEKAGQCKSRRSGARAPTDRVVVGQPLVKEGAEGRDLQRHHQHLRFSSTKQSLVGMEQMVRLGRDCQNRSEFDRRRSSRASTSGTKSAQARLR